MPQCRVPQQPAEEEVIVQALSAGHPRKQSLQLIRSIACDTHRCRSLLSSPAPHPPPSPCSPVALSISSRAGLRWWVAQTPTILSHTTASACHPHPQSQRGPVSSPITLRCHPKHLNMSIPDPDTPAGQLLLPQAQRWWARMWHTLIRFGAGRCRQACPVAMQSRPSRDCGEQEGARMVRQAGR